MSEALYQAAKSAMESVAQARVQSIIDATVDVHDGRVENIGLAFVQHKAFIDGVVAATRALTATHRKMTGTDSDEAQNAPPEEKGPVY